MGHSGVVFCVHCAALGNSVVLSVHDRVALYDVQRIIHLTTFSSYIRPHCFRFQCGIGAACFASVTLSLGISIFY